MESIGQAKRTFKKIDNKQGLSQNGVLAIFQDKSGYMWMGTHYGLNRYDGLTITSYFRGESYNDLCGNTIQAILQDRIGNIWIGTTEGVSVFNPLNEKFYNLSKYSSKNNVFTHTILSMKEIDGQILISSNEGLWKINPGKNLFTDQIAKGISLEAINCKLESDVKLETIRVFSKDKQDNYLLVANNHVIISKIVEKKLLVIDEIKLQGTNDLEINILYKDSFSNFWAGTGNQGLFQIFEDKGTYSTKKVYPNNESTSFSRITDILQDNEQNLWIASRSDGVVIIPSEGLKKNIINPVKVSEAELPSKKIRSIYKSRDQTLWLGSLGSGLFYYNSSGIKFKNYQFSNDLSKPVINTSAISAINYTRSINKDSYNRLWFGTLFEGLYIYDQDKLKVTKTLLQHHSIFALTEIDEHHFFAGCSDGLYLITYNKDQASAEKILLGEKMQGTVFSICNNSRTYWLGTGQNLISFQLSNDYSVTQIKVYNEQVLLSSKSQNTIRCVKFDKNLNCIWVGAEMVGLIQAKLDAYDQVSKFISINQMFKDSGISNYICDIFIDKTNHRWVATRNGLIHFQILPSGNISDFSIYSMRNGLPSNLIQSIQSDTIGNLWLGTLRGLVRFNKKTHEILNFNINDGIQDYEFAEHSSFVDENARMLFGGNNGVSEFSPYSMGYDNLIEPVFIQSIFINGKNSKNNAEFSNQQTLDLPYFENNVKFSFIAFNYINPMKCKYAYMLEGYDKDWIYTSSENRTAEYANLPRGHYVFKVKASNEDGIWEKGSTSKSFHIKPSFWASTPALVLYFCGIIGFVYIVSSITKKRVQKRQEALLEKQYHEKIEKINQAKIQFFINISHEIRTPLTLILCSIERLIGNLKLNTEQEKETARIEKSVNKMLGLTNELLEIQKIEIGDYQINVRKNDIVNFVKEIVLAFGPLAAKQNINLTLNSFHPEYYIWHDINPLEKAIYNLVSNAIKYTTSGGKIVVSINKSKNQDFLEINVADTGIGINKDHLSKIFDRYYHLDGNKDSYENGFGIGLSLTKNLIELHKGSISVTSIQGEGSEFTIHLPLDESVYTKEDKADKIIWKSDFTEVFAGIERKEKGDIDKVVQSINEMIDSPNPSKSTVLYIDDNDELLESVSLFLSESHNVMVAPNGKVGLEMAHQYQPDVIISDIVMPIMDGFELCRKVKNDVNTSHISVILLTARGDSDSQFKGIETGADYFIPKPFNIKLLSLTIKNLIDSRERLRQLFINNPDADPVQITTNSRDAEFLQTLLQYVDDHIGEPELNINYLAQTLSMSRSTFFRKIKAISGMKGKEFVDSIRLKKAAQLLIHSDMNISEVAYTIGHSNPQYFSKWFKAHYKVTPTEYIAQNKV